MSAHTRRLALVPLIVLLAAGFSAAVSVAESPEGAAAFVPHVIVGVPDTGINPYHELFYRPDLTEHPCTYIPDFPCSVQRLDLTLGGRDWDAAYAADKHVWEGLVPGAWYWIPRTSIVAATCEPGRVDTHCILDFHGHGTGSASSVVMENPDALLAIKEGGSRIDVFQSGGIPVDVYSVSWGNVVPVPGHPQVLCANFATAPVYVTSAGNDPRSTLVDCRKGEPSLITVGGAYAEDDTEEALAAKHPEVVSYYCRPTALPHTVTEMRPSYCGTSFSAPTVAGALSKVILGLREESGYTGSVTDGYVDPVLGVTTGDLRSAMNATATYDPEPQYDNRRFTGVPLNPVAPWAQWGWGFYDGTVAEATLAVLLGEAERPEKPEAAYHHMARVHAAKHALYGPLP